jgi:hypothetical protein
MIKVVKRFTGETIGEYSDTDALAKAAREGSLRSADLRSANLGGADLGGANLRSADLGGANLGGANLRSADLRSANLGGANLGGANLGGANLRSADLRSANLGGANLGGADLGGANLGGANLRSANLGGANLRSAIEAVQQSYGIAADPARAAAVLSQITEHPETWDQGEWHSSCQTRHCVAGWAVHQDGARGALLERILGTPTAAAVLLGVAGCELPSFDARATDDETIGRLRTIAAKAK